jgi:hypothetical protein
MYCVTGKEPNECPKPGEEGWRTFQEEFEMQMMRMTRPASRPEK